MLDSACGIGADGSMEASRRVAEDRRVAALQAYGLLDTPREEEFDAIVKVVSTICGTPISVINPIDRDRLWFKAEIGLGVRETPLPASICAHAILQPGLFIVPDTLEDRRFADNPLVTGDPRLRFYAGALLETPDGLPLGTICVLDYKPRQLDDSQQALLRLVARQIMKLFELRRINAAERQARAQAEVHAEATDLVARVDADRRHPGLRAGPPRGGDRDSAAAMSSSNRCSVRSSMSCGAPRPAGRSSPTSGSTIRSIATGAASRNCSPTFWPMR